MGRLLQRVEDAFAAPLDDTLLLLNVATGQYHALNPVASRIWELLSQPMDEDQLVAALVEEFEVAPEVCRHEVSPFLEGLLDRGLLITP
jgi:PqqD family protein of HPr-rel-A system